MATQPLTTPDSLDDSLIQAYQTQGFTRVSGILSKEEAADYYTIALDIMDREKDPMGGRVFTQIVNVWQKDDQIRPLTLHPNVAAVAERLAGVPLRLWHDHLLIKQPHNQAPTEFHQDQPYWPHANSTNSLSAWIALCDVPVERGCMTFIPGSHQRTDLASQNLRDPEDLLNKAPDLRWQPRVTLPLQAGDCTFHHSRCAHMAGSNLTDDPRVAHVIIYMDATTTYLSQSHVVTDPLNLTEGALLEEPFFPRLPGEAS
jgi:phytanoyl-CoA hydroxylase